MNSSYTTIRDLTGNPAIEAIELADVGGGAGFADEQPLGAAVRWSDVDVMWAEEQERRERLALCPSGFRDVDCVACGCCLYVPVGESSDILCPRCQREGEALAAEEDGDDEPTPPAGAALPDFTTEVAGLADDVLIAAISMADEGTPGRGSCYFLDIYTEEQRAAYLSAASRELLQRLDSQQRLAA